jgi:hypothetical protein
VNQGKVATLLAAFAMALLQGAGAQAEESDGPQLQEVVVTATAIPGTTIDIDKIPGNVQISLPRI